MSAVEFGELPEVERKQNSRGRWTGQRSPWEQRGDALMEHPGEWARCSTHPTPATAASVAAQLKRRRLNLPPGTFEWTQRGCDVWGRYIGPEDES